MDKAILVATIRFLSEAGQVPMTVVDVGRASGVSRPAIYPCWPLESERVADDMVIPLSRRASGAESWPPTPRSSWSWVATTANVADP